MGQIDMVQPTVSGGKLDALPPEVAAELKSLMFHEAVYQADRMFKVNGDHKRKAELHLQRLRDRAGSLLGSRTAWDFQQFAKWRTKELLYIRFQKNHAGPKAWRKRFHWVLENHHRLSRTFFKRFYDACHSISSHAVDKRSGERWWWNSRYLSDADKHKKNWEQRARVLATSVSFSSMTFFPEQGRIISSKPKVLKKQRFTNPTTVDGFQKFLVRSTKGQTHSVQKSFDFSVEVGVSVEVGFDYAWVASGKATAGIRLGLKHGRSWTSGTSSSETVEHSWTINVPSCTAIELVAKAVEVVVEVPFELIMRIGSTNWSTKGTWNGVASGTAELEASELPSPCR